MDPETMYGDVTTVGVNDGRMVAIAKNAITGKEAIHAKGLVVGARLHRHADR